MSEFSEGTAAMVQNMTLYETRTGSGTEILLVKCSDSLTDFCHYCGERNEIEIETCHLRCLKCHAVSNGCGD